MPPDRLTEDPEFTRRLREWLTGNGRGGVADEAARSDAPRGSASNTIMDALGGELTAIARRIVSRQPPESTLQATALLNEFWLKLSRARDCTFKDRRHFMGIAVTTMRWIVVDHIRSKRADRLAPADMRVEMSQAIRTLEDRGGIDLVELDDALEVLGEQDPDALKVIELRFFGGLDLVETAEILGWSRGRVKSEQVLACKRLAQLMS